MKQRIGLGINSTGLGDCIVNLPLARALGDRCVFELHPNQSRFQFLFDDVCDTMLTENPAETRNGGHPSWHFAAQKLDAYGLGKADWTPRISKQWFGAKHQADVFISNGCAAEWMNLRGGHRLPWNAIAARLDGYSMFQTGGDTETPVVGASFEKDMPLPDVVVAMKLCRVALVVDSGLHHLAVSMGMPTVVLHPHDCPEYRHSNWHYRWLENASYYPFERVMDAVEKVAEILDVLEEVE